MPTPFDGGSRSSATLPSHPGDDGARIDDVDEKGKSALHLAASWGHAELVSWPRTRHYGGCSKHAVADLLNARREGEAGPAAVRAPRISRPH
eukprot:gene3709-42215_t